MSIPHMAHVLNGWIKKQHIKIITKINAKGKITEVAEDVHLFCNKQPTPASIVNRKPEEERFWNWYTITVQGKLSLHKDDIFVIDNIRYKIDKINDIVDESGFAMYECIQDYRIT